MQLLVEETLAASRPTVDEDRAERADDRLSPLFYVLVLATSIVGVVGLFLNLTAVTVVGWLAFAVVVAAQAALSGLRSGQSGRDRADRSLYRASPNRST